MNRPWETHDQFLQEMAVVLGNACPATSISQSLSVQFTEPLMPLTARGCRDAAKDATQCAAIETLERCEIETHAPRSPEGLGHTTQIHPGDSLLLIT